jgi:hypothetical protein
MEKATKASILTKQNSNFARSKEFWKRWEGFFASLRYVVNEFDGMKKRI